MRALPTHPHPHLRAFIKWALLAMIALFAARAVHAEVAKIVQTYTVPGSSLLGIAYDGSSIWIIDNLENVYQVDPVTFATISTCAAGGSDRSGLTWDGSNLWIVNGQAYGGGGMDKVDSSCNVLASLAISHWSYSGSAWGGGYVWSLDYNSNLCYKHNGTTGGVLLYWDVPMWDHPSGIVYDGQNLWIGGYTNIGKFSTTGSSLFSFDLATDLGISGGQLGLAWDNDKYLWISLSNGFNVYKVAVCGTIAISPASLANVALNSSSPELLSATGGELGTSPFTFAVTAGSLPPGLTLNADGSFSGTASSAGTYNFTVTTTAANTCTATKDYSILVAGPPSISSVTPNKGLVDGGTNVTIAGSGFQSGAAVTFGGVAATNVVIGSSTSITATTPAHNRGAVDVVVTNPDTQSGTLASGFTYELQFPSVSPCSGPPAGGNSVTLAGTGLASATAVLFDGVDAPVLSSTIDSLTVSAPPHAAGSVAIEFVLAGGNATFANAYHYYTPPGTVAWSRVGAASLSTVIKGLGVDPSNVNNVFAGKGDTFGFFKSSDGGATWTSPTGASSEYGVWAFAVDPMNSNIVYNGKQKSIDGGTTWTDVNSNSYHRAIAINPVTTSTVFTGLDGYYGVQKSTTGGASWTTVLPETFVHGLAIDPQNPSVVYAATQPYSATPGGLYKTTDGGTNWVSVLAQNQVNGVVVDRLAPSRVYAAVEGGGIFRSEDAGANWTNTNNGLAHLLAHAIAIDPADTNVLYAGTWEGGVYRSTDCGESWSQLNNGLGDPYTLSLAISAANHEVVYSSGEGGGVYRLATILPPSISQVTPSSGPLTGGTSVTITGTALDTVTSVTFGGVAATNVVAVNPTTVTATTPTHAAGAVDVVATTSFSLSDTLPGGFTYIDPPSITSISPTSGTTAGGTNVTITGAHFTTGATVMIGAVAATTVNVSSATTITATTQASAPGLVSVVVTNPDGQSATLPFAYSYLSPPGNDYYVNGTTGSNTTSGGTLAAPWKTITYALTRISGYGHTLHVASGTYDTTLGETFPILIKNGVSISGAGAGTTILDAGGSNVVMKAVAVTDPGTTIQKLTIRGGGNTREGAGILITAASVVKITNNLITGNTVSFGDITSHYGGGIQVLNASPQIVGNDIRGNIVISGFSTSSPHPSSFGGGIAVSGATAFPTISQNVIANNEARNGSFSNAAGGGIAVVDGATPTITDNTISGNDLPRLSATADFNLGGAIYFEASGGVVSGNTITANTSGLSFGDVVASGAVHVAGASPTIRRNVIAGNDDHGIWCDASAAPLIENNTIVSSTLSGIHLASASPSIVNNILYGNATYGIEEATAASDPSSARYNLFFANGGGLYRDEAASDYFSAATLNSSVAECANNIEGDPLFVNSGSGDYHILEGSVAIDSGDPATEQDPDGSRADIGALPYAQASPVISSITPAAGTTAGGTTVTISGSNFAAGATVRLGSTNANVTSVSAASITATTAPAGEGTVNVIVTNPDGLRGTLAGGFTYVSSPGYTSLAPAVGPAAGGASVTITGVNLTGAISVTFGGIAGAITANTSTSITVTTPPHNAGTVDVVIDSAGGSVTATSAYTFMAAPTITGITPDRGPTAGGTSVTITGTNLTDVTSVVFGGVAGTIVSKSATLLTATTPAHAAESSVWRAEAQITEFTGDGLQGVSISGARDTLGFTIPANDSRFGFEIVTSGTSSFELQASGGPGRVDLSWTASTLETLAGYNLYRANTSGGPYVKVNASLVAQTAYSDFTVTPNVPYYYVYRVVNTSLEEASDSNEASATASDASAPVITHSPVTTATEGVPITIVATITDNLGVASATVFHRALGATASFAQVAMINATGSQYAANIPAAAAVAPGVEYYIEASDGTAISRDGSPAAPHVVTVAASQGVPGDANGDGSIGPDDVVFLLNYLLANGASPGASGDANGDGQVTIADLFYLINYLFSGGPPP